MKKRPLIAYFTILAVLCGGIVIGARMMGEQGTYLAQGYMLTPALAAIITRLFFYEGSFKDANLRFGRATDYLKVWLAALGITAVSYLLYTLLGAVRWDRSGMAFMERMAASGMPAAAMLEGLPPGFTVQTMLLLFTLGGLTVFNILPGLITGFGEEFGHRGLMFPLLHRINPWLGLIGGGLIWFAWHLPLMLIMPETTNPTAGEFALRSLIGTTGSVCTFIYLAYIYVKSGSIFVTSLAHIAMNNASMALSYYIVVRNQLLASAGTVLTMMIVVGILYLAGELRILGRMQLNNANAGRQRI